MITMNELNQIIKSKRSMTGGELDRLLQSCPEWVEQDRQRRAAHQARVDRLKIEVAPENEPLIQDLKVSGTDVESVWELVNTGASYPKAIPVLMKHLETAQHPIMRQGIVRALTVREARGLAGDLILRELVSGKDEGEPRIVVANALTIVADPTNAAKIEILINDPAYDDVRSFLEKALATASKPLPKGTVGHA